MGDGRFDRPLRGLARVLALALAFDVVDILLISRASGTPSPTLPFSASCGADAPLASGTRGRPPAEALLGRLGAFSDRLPAMNPLLVGEPDPT